MKIETNKIDGIVFAGLFGIKAGALEQKKRDDKLVLTAAGKPIYKTGLKALKVVNGAVEREEQNVSLWVLEPLDILPGVHYQPAGKIEVVHYITNTSRLGVSITAEKLVPVNQGESK